MFGHFALYHAWRRQNTYDSAPMGEQNEVEELDPADVELGRRVAAALAYRGLTYEDLGAALERRRQTVSDYVHGRIDDEMKREALEAKTAELADLPREFFQVNFDDLPNMLKAWASISELPEPEELEALVAERLKQDPTPR